MTTSNGIILPAPLSSALATPTTGCIISDTSTGPGFAVARCTLSELTVAGTICTILITAPIVQGAWSLLLPFAALSSPGAQWHLTTPGGAIYQGAVPTLAQITLSELLSGYGWFPIGYRLSRPF